MEVVATDFRELPLQLLQERLGAVLLRQDVQHS